MSDSWMLFLTAMEKIAIGFFRVTSRPYDTRYNIDYLLRRLEKHGVTDVLSTNVICYSTPMSKDLKDPSHRAGAAQGRKIFQTIFEIIKPKIIIVHGGSHRGAAKELNKLLGRPLPPPPTEFSPKPVEAILGKLSVFVIRSLARPESDKWSSWRNKHLEDVCRTVAARLG